MGGDHASFLQPEHSSNYANVISQEKFPSCLLNHYVRIDNGFIPSSSNNTPRMVDELLCVDKHLLQSSYGQLGEWDRSVAESWASSSKNLGSNPGNDDRPLIVNVGPVSSPHNNPTSKQKETSQ